MKRVLWMIPVMLMVIVVVFTITYIAPGRSGLSCCLAPTKIRPDGVREEGGGTGTRQELPLFKGYFVSVGTYIWNLVTKLDLGKSLQTNIPVARELAARLPITFTIVILGMLLMMAIGSAPRILSALKQYSALDITLTSNFPDTHGGSPLCAGAIMRSALWPHTPMAAAQRH
jgi:peptide/nickel transport system permease protein